MPTSQPGISLLPQKQVVNSPPPEISNPRSKAVIHHKGRGSLERIVLSYVSLSEIGRYGVSSSRRLISRPLFIRRYDRIREFLRAHLGLNPAQREVALRLLRLWAYYGLVYPKESQITREPGCSKATYWRTVRQLRELGLVQVVNRFVVRPHAQISNLYRLDRLALALARYLAEHGQKFRETWLAPYLAMGGRSFWAWALPAPVAITGPP